jgi:hypothetical protein
MIMGYPPYNQPPGQPFGGGYPQQGYGQQAPQPFAQQPQQGYQQQQFAPEGAGGYNFADLYGQADLSAGSLLERGKYLARPESAEFGRSKDGTKGQWTVAFRTQTGVNKNPQAPGNGAKLTVTISISPKKNDGGDNKAGLGIMFKQLHALGIPVGPPLDPTQQPFWMLGMNEQMVAQEIMRQARLVELTVVQNEYPEGSGQFNNKISRIDPVDGQAAAPVQGQQQMFGSQPPPQGVAPGPQQGGAQFYPQQGQQQFEGQGYGQGFGQPQQGQQAPGPFQSPGFGQPGQVPPPGAQQFQGGPGAPGQPAPGMGQVTPANPVPGPGYDQAVPPYAQPAQPGQGGLNQFTPQGQGTQPGTVPGHDQQVPMPPFNQGGQQQGQQQYPPQQGAPEVPPWA